MHKQTMRVLTVLFSTLFVAIIVGACGDEVSGKTPQIESFSAFPSLIEPGEPTLLAWRIIESGTTTLAIDQGVGDVSGITRVSVNPLATTTYTLTAANEFGSATASATATVGSVGPTIVSFHAEPTIVISGEASTLTWMIDSFTSTELTIDQGVGDVSDMSNVTVTPTTTTTYTLTASSDAGSDTAMVTVQVTDQEIVEGSLSPTESTCDAIAVDVECSVAVSLLDITDSFKGVEFEFASSAFSLLNADTSSITNGCLIDAGASKVILACSDPFDGPGDVAVLTLRRTSANASALDIMSAFVAVDSSEKIPVSGGALLVAAAN